MRRSTSRRVERVLAIGITSIVASIVASGCGSRCREVAAIKRELTQRTTIVLGPHAQVQIPLTRANAFVAELLRDEPITVPLAVPELAMVPLPIHELTATAREVQLKPARPDRIRFAIRVEIADAQQPITTLAIETEIEPQLVRDRDATELVAGFGPENLIAVRPELGQGAGHALGEMIAGWLPAAVRDRVPRMLIDRAAEQLAGYLTGEAYQVLQTTLLRRLGELTRFRVRLPELPIAKTALSSSNDALVVDIATDLPVRGGLGAAPPRDDEVEVRISGSTAAELANWAIAHGHLPPYYTRDLEPKPDGEYRPRFDYIAGDRARPVKVHVLQERGGCSYFGVGLRLQIAIVDDKLDIAMLDRFVERAHASPALEAGLWLKQLVQGSVDRSQRAAARTELAFGGRRFVTRVVRAAVVDDELRFALRFERVVSASGATSAAP
jgi:hypothetical protein